MKKMSMEEFFDFDQDTAVEATLNKLDKSADNIIALRDDIEQLVNEVEAGNLNPESLEKRNFDIVLPKVLWQAFDEIVTATRATTETMPVETATDMFAVIQRATKGTVEEVILCNAVMNHLFGSITRIATQRLLISSIEKLQEQLKDLPQEDGVSTEEN